MRAKDHLGNSYTSMKAMAEHYGMSRDVFLYRYRTMSLKDALTTCKCYDHKGNGFNSFVKMCKYWGINYNSFYYKYNKLHLPIEKCLMKERKK